MDKSIHGKPLLVVDQDSLRQIIEEILQSIPQQNSEKEWLSQDEAMSFLNLKSKTSMQKIRDCSEVEFSQPMKKVILYRRSSLLAYLEKHSRKTF